MFYNLLKNILFRFDPELAHDLTLKSANLAPWAGKIGTQLPSPSLHVKVGSLNFHSPVGLAAGLDKNGNCIHFFQNQGFGSLEIGTVTLKPQLGNPRPRIFRYSEEESIRNAMGFPSNGHLQVHENLKSCSPFIPIGLNIGKNKDSTAAESIDELVSMTKNLESSVDYIAVNVSSPNTPGLRELQEKNYLTELFQKIQNVTQKDLYLKIAPDLNREKLMELIELTHDLKLTGIIATNTTIMPEKGNGGVSGKLLTNKARDVRNFILQEKPNFEVVGVGGISSFEDLAEFWYHGGKVAQIYTSYIYQGPKILKDMYLKTECMLHQHKLNNLNDFFKLELEFRREILDQELKT